MSRSVKASCRFSAAVQHLELLRVQLIEELRNGDESRLQQKLQIDDAIQCLTLCETHSIRASAKVLQLPPTRTRTPSSEYRIVEDHETDDRRFWTELRIGTADVRPLPGTLLLTRSGTDADEN